MGVEAVSGTTVYADGNEWNSENPGKYSSGTFCYNFCSKHMSKLSYKQKKWESTLLERVEEKSLGKSFGSRMCY